MAAHRATSKPESRLWAMSAAERVEAMRAGELSISELAEWSRRAPREVPLLDGEFEWIARTMPEAVG